MIMITSSKHRFILSFLIVLALWWLSSGTIFVEGIVPNPKDVAILFAELIANGKMFTHIFVSFKRILLGFLIGVLCGTSIGLLVGAYTMARTIFTPIVEFFRNIPPVALIPLVVSIFGIGETGKYFIIAYAATFVMIINTAAGVTSTPAIRVRAAQCLGANSLQIVRWVVIPSAWPYILTGLRLALSFSFMGVVAAEMLAADSGIGFLIMQSTNILRPEDMFVGFVLLGTFGFLTDQLFKLAVGKMLRRYMFGIENI